MAYDEENTILIKEKYDEIDHMYSELMHTLLSFRSKLTNKKASEYLMQGVSRRLNILTRCLHNIFRIFPIEKTDLLPKDDLTDLNINLHAFFVNISGLFDNLAWVFVYENNLFGDPKKGKIDKNGVGLFKKETQKHFKPEFNQYLKSDRTKSWYAEYTKNYRDALAHRIPLYVPPAALNDEETEEYILLQKQLDFTSPESNSRNNEILEKLNNMGQACLLFTHSSNEECKPLYLHAQVIADFTTIEDTINKFCDYCMQ